MKTIKTTMLIATLILGMLMSYATGNLSKGDYISVSNADDEIIYSGRVSYNGNLKTHFDFSKLSNGQYTIEVEKDFIIEINIVEVEDKIVRYIDSAAKKVFKPVLRTENTKVLLSKIAFNTDTIEVELYFDGELIHSETIEGNNQIIDRVYRLDETQVGEYKAIIRANERVFIERFKI